MRFISLANAPFLILSILAACLILNAPGINTGLIWHRIVLPLLRILGIMSISLTLSAIVEAMGWYRLVVRISSPLIKHVRLSQWSAVAFSTAFLSGIAANTFLWNAFKDGHIKKREMYVATLLNLGLPSYALHLPTTMAITVSLVGKAGLIYVIVTFFAALIRTISVLTAGIFLLPEPDEKTITSLGNEPVTNRNEQVKKLLKRYLMYRLPRIAKYTVPIYVIVVSLGQMNFFNWLQNTTASFFSTDILPVKGVSVVVFSIMAEFTSGAAAAGAMLSQGILQVKETVIALLIGSIMAAPVRALRHQLPSYLGIFTPSTGTAILLMGQGLRITSVLAAGILFYLIY